MGKWAVRWTARRWTWAAPGVRNGVRNERSPEEVRGRKAREWNKFTMSINIKLENTHSHTLLNIKQ